MDYIFVKFFVLGVGLDVCGLDDITSAYHCRSWRNVARPCFLLKEDLVTCS